MTRIMSKQTSAVAETPTKSKKKRLRGSSSKRVACKRAPKDKAPDAVRRRLDFGFEGDDAPDSGSRAARETRMEASPAQTSSGEDDDLFGGQFKPSRRTPPASAKMPAKQSGSAKKKQKTKTASEEAGLEHQEPLGKGDVDEASAEEDDSQSSGQEAPEPTKEASTAGKVVEPELVRLLTASTSSFLDVRLNLPGRVGSGVAAAVSREGRARACVIDAV